MHAVPVQRSALKQRSECVGRGAKYRSYACMGGLGRIEKRMRDCPYVWLLGENGTQKEKDTKGDGGKRNMRAVCEMACSCYLHRGHDKAASCDGANHREKG